MCWTPPQSPPHACAYVSEDKWVGPPLPRPRLHTPIRTGVAPGPDRHQRPIQTGGGGECIVHARPALGKAGRLVTGRLGPVAHVAWRGAINPWELPIAHPRSHPGGRGLGRPLAPRPTQPHARHCRTRLEFPQTSRKGGLAGSSGPPGWSPTSSKAVPGRKRRGAIRAPPPPGRSNSSHLGRAGAGGTASAQH